MAIEIKEDLIEARKLMDSFSRRTGLIGEEGDIQQRYLWTDAFAVKSFFALAQATGENIYKDRAFKLIDTVHEKLGRFHPDDSRKGWISGLPEGEGKKHPTAGGLRIGKKFPERKEHEPFNESLEWERDGQYFHYLTRWIDALLQAEKESDSTNYALWAAELLQAGSSFIYKIKGKVRMYWKMSIDLSRPLISNMGAHDPLEGLICAETVVQAVPEKSQELYEFVKDLEELCSGSEWTTTDDLGIGGLLLNAVRVSELAKENVALSKAIKPEKLLADSLESLKYYDQMYDKKRPASQRLAFRECGLSLGLRTLSGLKDRPKEITELYNQIYSFRYLAEDIEDFWKSPVNRQSSTWLDHLDINEVSLASSLAAKFFPQAF